MKTLNSFQRAVLVIGAIAFVVALATAPSYQIHDGNRMDAGTVASLADIRDVGAAMVRGLGVLGATGLLVLAVAGLGGKQNEDEPSN